MIERVSCVWLCCIVTLVVSNPVPSQISQFQSSSPYQVHASQNRLNLQNAAVPNQALQNNLDSSINELLKNILGNPSLQKVLDPNTKFYNQNGQEVQKKAKADATPNVVNNYFIVPPEFFNANNNQTIDKSKPRKKKKSIARKVKSTELRAKPNNSENSQVKLTKDFDKNGVKNNKGRSRKRNKNQNLTKIDNDGKKTPISKGGEKPKNKSKRTKSKRNQELSQNKYTKMISALSTIENSKSDINQEENRPVIKSNTSKKRMKVKNKQDASKHEATSNIHIPELVNILEDDLSKIESIPTGKEKDTEGASYLKNIESPVDNCETNENDRCIKREKDNRKTRNPKNYKSQKEILAPVTDDILKNYYPYLYMGNNFYPNSKHPFNFDQIYRPYLQPPMTQKKKNKNSKSRKTQNSSLKTDVAKKEKKQEVATTQKPPIRVNTLNPKLDSKKLEASSESLETVLTRSLNETDTNYKNEVNKTNNENLSKITEIKTLEETVSELTVPKKESVIPKAYLEMPPTVIEDIKEINSPELGREDIVPTAHTNGIVNDYYPIFNDDSYYTNNDFFLRELEDDRHFYTTDRGFEDHLNRERTKYEENVDYERNNINMRDETNFRRAYKYKERDKTKESKERNKINKDKYINAFTQNTENPEHTTELQFQTPPTLENPDFQTKRIEKIASSYDVNNKVKLLGYSDFMKNFSDFNINPNTNEKIVNFEDTYLKKDTTPTITPINDRIETVYAKTRVIKYGTANEESDEISSFDPVNDKIEDKYYNDGHTTYVVAKSLGKVDDYYW